jgi:hypothetical protein
MKPWNVSSAAIHHFSDLWRKRFALQIIAFSLLSFCLSIHSVESEIVEIQLPELTGIYTMDTLSQTTTFDLGQPLAEVRQVWIRWAGTITYGTGHGDGVIRPSDEWFPWACLVFASMDTPGLAYWDASFGPVEGSFQDTTVFEGTLDPSWDFLMDGTGELRAGLSPEIILGGAMVDSPVVELDAVSLIFDIDFVTDVGNTSTWGQIKARFRTNSTSP